ncbi:MAG: hypothetical protein IJT30_07335 [Muribaculaceae bacterium]|nr:hypothetical protein [Muribaculaceae bacterium]
MNNLPRITFAPGVWGRHLVDSGLAMAIGGTRLKPLSPLPKIGVTPQ